jgi:hypothetical protein
MAVDKQVPEEGEDECDQIHDQTTH